MKHIVMMTVIAVVAAAAVPRSEREVSSLLIRSGIGLVELGLSLNPRPKAPFDELEPDTSVEDAVSQSSPRPAAGRQA